MKITAKIIVFLFFVVVLLFTIQQHLIGNPFNDEIHPIIIQIIFLLISFITVVKLKKIID
jgi:hypothetical protein